MMRRLAIFALLGLALAVPGAVAHESVSGWQYPWECCHNLDCSEISRDRIAFVSGGYLVDSKFFVAQKDVKIAPDGRYHACFPTPDKLRCFFAPPMGF